MPTQLQDTGLGFVNVPPSTLTWTAAQSGSTLLLVVTSRNPLPTQTDPSFDGWVVDAQYQPFTNNPGVTVFRKTASGGEASVVINYSNAIYWRLVEYSDFQVSSVDVKTATGGDSINVTTVSLAAAAGSYAVGAVGVRTASGAIDFNNVAALNQQSNGTNNAISHGSFHGTNPAAQLDPTWATAGRTNAVVVGYTLGTPPAGTTLRPEAIEETQGWTGAHTDIDEETLNTADKLVAAEPDGAVVVVRFTAMADTTDIPTFKFYAADPDNDGTLLTVIQRQGYTSPTSRGTVVQTWDPIVLSATPTEYSLVGVATSDTNPRLEFVADSQLGATEVIIGDGSDVTANKGDTTTVLPISTVGYATPPTLSADQSDGSPLPAHVGLTDNGDGTGELTLTHTTVGQWTLRVTASETS